MARRFRLLADFGTQAFGIAGVRHGLPAGAVGILDEEVAAGTKGAHNDFEDAYVLTFPDDARSIGKDGGVVIHSFQRRISFAVDAFDPANPERLFEEVQ